MARSLFPPGGCLGADPWPSALVTRSAAAGRDRADDAVTRITPSSAASDCACSSRTLPRLADSTRVIAYSTENFVGPRKHSLWNGDTSLPRDLQIDSQIMAPWLSWHGAPRLRPRLGARR